MVTGAYIRGLRGQSGQITVPGIGAVVGEFQQWNLSRHEERGSVEPTWTLHAVFRYQNDLLLKNDALKKRIRLQLNDKTKIDLCSWDDMRVEGSQVFVERCTQCQT